MEAEEVERAGDQPFIDALQRDILDPSMRIDRERWIQAAAVARKLHGSGSARTVAEMILVSESTVCVAGEASGTAVRSGPTGGEPVEVSLLTV